MVWIGRIDLTRWPLPLMSRPLACCVVGHVGDVRGGHCALRLSRALVGGRDGVDRGVFPPVGAEDGGVD